MAASTSGCQEGGRQKEYSQAAGSSYLCPTLCIKPNCTFQGNCIWWFKWLENWYMRDAVWFLYVFIHLTNHLATYWVPTLSPKVKSVMYHREGPSLWRLFSDPHASWVYCFGGESCPHSILYGRLLGWEQQPSQCGQTVRCAGLGLRGRMKTWESSLEKLGRGQAVNTVWFRQCPPCVWHIALQMLFYLISITDRYYSNPTLAHQASTFNSSQGQEAWKTEAIAAGSRAGHEKTSQRKM